MSRQDGGWRDGGGAGGPEADRRDALESGEDLTREEAMAFQRLPREAEPSRLLEERVVRALREEGVLGAPVAAGIHPPARGRATTWLRPWMLAASMAASVVLFASGVFLGHGMATRSTAEAFLAVREQDATQLALTIQQAGSAYVSALVALGELTQGGAGAGEPGGATLSAALSQGSEVALASMYAAAYELARLDPGDADVLRILRILEERRSREGGGGDEARNVVWF